MKTSLLFALIACFFLAGCETPESRIRSNPAAFDRLSPPQQQLVKQGRVDVGFDEGAVRLALGDPDRIYERVDQTGKSYVWVYVNYRTPDGVILYRGYYHRYWGDPFFPYYSYYPEHREYDRTRVTFKDGHVISAQQETSG